MNKIHIDTIAIHGGYNSNELRDITSPIHPTTIFKHNKGRYDHEKGGYSREKNPNRIQTERVIAKLEEAKYGICFSSGIASVAAALNLVEKGKAIVIGKDLYHGSRVLIESFCEDHNQPLIECDLTDNVAILDTITAKNTGLIWIETPSNPRFDCIDFPYIGQKKHTSALMVVDNTWLTPLLSNPLNHGADVVVHSCSKYLGGHSDILSGAALTNRDDLHQELRSYQIHYGAVPSPFDMWLLERSIKTFPLRFRTQQSNAEKIARWLDTQDKVGRVYYPGNYEVVAASTFSTFSSGNGAMISFEVNGSEEDTVAVIQRSNIIKQASSLGGVESTWEHRRSTEGEFSDTPANLIRLSVGIEKCEDLIYDLDQALNSESITL